MKNAKELPAPERDELLDLLKKRFEKNMHRHKDMVWNEVEAKLLASPQKLWSLNAMEQTGGEPDVVEHDTHTAEYVFYDCAAESPKGRRSVCYDHQALEERKEYKPEDSALNMAADMGIAVLNEEQYRRLQQTGKYDTKTSSWITTPAPIRKLGGALFGDFRYDTVFFYHNGASSYYAARGFRGVLRV